MSKLSTRMTAIAVALVLCLVAPAAYAISTWAQTVIDEMIGGKHPEAINYSFLQAGYDDGSNELQFAVTDGQHFRDTTNLYYNVPVADIDSVTVISNADKTIKEGEVKNIGNDMGTNETGFRRIPQGCSVKMTSKGANFGWTELGEGDIKDGKLVNKPSDDDLESLKSVTFGFYDCKHARELQNAIHDLHKQVKKGG